MWRPEFANYMIEGTKTIITFLDLQFKKYFDTLGTPGKPYGGLLAHFNIVEANMKARRDEVKLATKLRMETLLKVKSYLVFKVTALLGENEQIFSITAFPRSGCEDFCTPAAKPKPETSASRSLFFPDEAIYLAHPRFRTLTRNIRERRGEKVAINIPSN